MAVTGSPELLIVMGASATADQTEHVLSRLAEHGVEARVQRGREATVIGAIGDREQLALLPLEGYPGVEQVLPILKPYKLVGREIAPDPTVIDVEGRKIGDGFFGLIAGPCTVEYREQTLETARAVAAAGATWLRGGAFKPRTSPYTFQGIGFDALEILREAKEETGLPIDAQGEEGIVVAGQPADAAAPARHGSRRVAHIRSTAAAQGDACRGGDVSAGARHRHVRHRGGRIRAYCSSSQRNPASAGRRCAAG